MNSEKTPQKTAIIYLSGAGLTPAIWDAVHSKVTTPNVALTYNRDTTTTLQSAVQDVLGQIQKIDATRYVIVAHSLGGVIGVELARTLQDKLGGLIAVSATIPAPGKSFINTLPFPQNFVMPLLLKVAGTKPPASAIQKSLCSDLSDQQATDIINAFVSEPRNLYSNKTSTSMLPASKYLYVRTLNDKQTPTQLQSSMAKQLPDAKITDIASGHLAMMSHPDELAEIINNFIANL
ncbi:MAG TPA: alpha/beta hydrolase [Candidatus Saccharimonadia bacterium]|nr:alpha/beta hydrolase [Candidatus Saccharimonadia bacterium]